MFNAETGGALDETVNPGNASALNVMLSNQQKWLVGQHAFLLGKVRTTVALTPGTRYYAFPESTIDIDRLDRDQFIKDSSGIRFLLHFGITAEQYALYDSAADVRLDPVCRWDLVWDTTLKIEVWPLPATAQTMELSGVKVLSPLTSDSHTADLDDMLIVLFTAAEFLARDKKSDSQAKLAKAQALLNSMRGSRASGLDRMSMAGDNGQFGQRRQPRRVYPISV